MTPVVQSAVHEAQTYRCNTKLEEDAWYEEMVGSTVRVGGTTTALS